MARNYLHALLLLGCATSTLCAAQVYRCTDAGKIVYSDRPCGQSADSAGIKSAAGASTKSAPQPVPVGGNPARNPAQHGGETYEADQKSELQAKLVQCITDGYNAWIKRQTPRPSAAARDAQLTKIQEECRGRYPVGVRKPVPPPPQANADLDAFREAIKSGKLELVKARLDANVDPNSIFTTRHPIRKELRTPALIFAVNNSTEQVSSLLIERGANIMARDSYGGSALHAAAQWGRIATINLLISRGADIAVRNDSGYTPLHSAIQGLQLEAVKVLLLKGADINAQADRYGTPLTNAITGNSNNERLPIIRHLLSNGANPNISETNGDYPLHLAVQGRGNQPMTEVIQALLGAGAKLDVRNKLDETPLAMAERLERSEAVQLLKSPSPIRK